MIPQKFREEIQHRTVGEKKIIIINNLYIYIHIYGSTKNVVMFFVFF